MSQSISRRVILIAVLLCAAAVGAVFWIQTLQMPGELSLAHAAYEKDCSTCHLPWTGLSTQACLKCHQDIAQQLSGAQGEHAAAHDECQACHIEHQGRDAYIVPTTRGFVQDDSCINCHTNATLLNAVGRAETPAPTPEPDTTPEPPRDFAVAYLVDVPDMLKSAHGQLHCTDCHLGNRNALTKAGAHQGLVRDPSADPVRACGQIGCHVNKSAAAPKSPHYTAQDLVDRIADRSSPQVFPTIQAQAQKCARCHSTCGDCHVSKTTPNDDNNAYVSIGLRDQHRFGTGATLGAEFCDNCHAFSQQYLGENGGFAADVHWANAKLSCLDCHPDTTLHGAASRGMDEATTPRARPCESCHSIVLSGDTGNLQHDLHAQQVDCRVCHGQAYNNCYDCHVQRADRTIHRQVTKRPMQTMFKIGRVYAGDANAAARYTTVVHVPTTRDMFDEFGENMLPNFDAIPTWRPYTGHNILRQTKQNASCKACHENPALWLVPSELDANDARANQFVAGAVPDITTTVTDADNGKTIRLKRGAFLEIELPAQEGSSWNMVAGDEKILAPQFDITKIRDALGRGNAAQGERKQYVYEFQALQEGTLTLRLERQPVNGQGNAGAREFHLEIEVQPRD